VRHARFDAAERATLEQVRRVHCVPGGTKLVGKGDDARGEALRVVEQDDLGHGALLSGGGIGDKL
jgi:hypothetical protein